MCGRTCSGNSARGAVVQKRPRLDLKSPRNARDVVDGDVALGSLDPTQIGAVDPTFVGQRLLAQTALSAQATHVSRQHVSEWSFVSLLHTGIAPTRRF